MEAQVQESVLRDVLQYCRSYQLKDAYRAFRLLIISKPTLHYSEYRKLLSSDELRPLRELLSRLEIYVDMVKLAEDNEKYYNSSSLGLIVAADKLGKLNY